MEFVADKSTRPGFVRRLEETHSPVITDYLAESDVMLVAFGGIMGFRAIPPVEFWRITQNTPAKKIFLRDLSQAWYQAGLPALAVYIDGIADYLRRQVDEQKPKRLVMIGNSMGGYAALLFGLLLNADVSISIAPQTFLGLARRVSCLDFRWFPQLWRAARYNRNRLHLDLRQFFCSRPALKGNSRYTIAAFMMVSMPKTWKSAG
jgi:hypothetical protein